jgi:RecA/RadA recombinase
MPKTSKVQAKKPVYTGPRYVDPNSIPRADANELLDTLQATLGGDGVILQQGVEVEGRLDLRRPSGITQLDIACGGGLPAGGLSQIDGADGVGKNLLMNYYFAKQQSIHGDATNLAMVCLESGYDKLFGRAVGVKVALSPYEIEAEGRRRRMKGEPELTEEEVAELQSQVGNFHIFRGAASEKILEAVVHCVASNSYQIIGIDSWDAMLTAAEEGKELEDNAKVADASGIQTRWMRKVFGALSPQKICPDCFSRPLGFKQYGKGNFDYTCPESKCGWKGKKPYMWENETTLIGIRQIRANLNKMGMHARDYKVGGAYALRHGKMIDIALRRGKPIELSNTNIGKEINWELTKGKAGTHEGLKGAYEYYYAPPGIDLSSDLVNYCSANNIIQYGGPKVGFYVTSMDGSEQIKLGTKEEMQRRVEEDKDIEHLLRVLSFREAGLGRVRFK